MLKILEVLLRLDFFLAKSKTYETALLSFGQIPTDFCLNFYYTL